MTTLYPLNSRHETAKKCTINQNVLPKLICNVYQCWRIYKKAYRRKYSGKNENTLQHSTFSTSISLYSYISNSNPPDCLYPEDRLALLQIVILVEPKNRKVRQKMFFRRFAPEVPKISDSFRHHCVYSCIYKL